MNAQVIEKMLLIVRWQQMREFCLTEDRKCSNCPYEKMKECDVASTEEVMRSCANAFGEWLFGEEGREQISCADNEP